MGTRKSPAYAAGESPMALPNGCLHSGLAQELLSGAIERPVAAALSYFEFPVMPCRNSQDLQSITPTITK